MLNNTKKLTFNKKFEVFIMRKKNLEKNTKSKKYTLKLGVHQSQSFFLLLEIEMRAPDAKNRTESFLANHIFS